MAANAADMSAPVYKAPPPPPPPSWTGFYVGLSAGYSWGRWNGDLTFDPGTGPLPVFDPSNRTISANGWLGGAQAGFNYQLGSWVLGLESDVSWTSLKGANTFVTSAGFMAWNISNRLDWFSTVRGRAGYAIDKFLIYATGGGAFGQTNSNEIVTQVLPPLVTAVASVRENHVGWTAGGGVEWLYSRNLSFKLEYLRVDLGSAPYRFIGTVVVAVPPMPHTTDSFPADLAFQIVRAGVNYRF
jgi:outer membrane immunogenic protein